jgi:DNA (cytosine-5)-methyltransferase 1|tara:strand:- start:77 stop:946 length:870 start_codon:yes stop_codon:yes gene_type:complete
MLDTFAGIGGFSYAATKLVGGYRTTQFIEIDPFCQKILKKHFPFTPIHDDIRTFTAIPGQYDVICGGFPCQSISVAGNRAGITEESRSGIFYELMRVIRMVRPRFVVLENVAAILNNGLDIVLGELSQAGYDAEWSVISASSLGACHRRSRWWCVAYTNDYGSPTSSISGLDDQANNDSSERSYQVSQSSRSSESKDSRVVQSSTKPSNSNSKRLQRQNFNEMEREIWSKGNTRRLDPNWRSYVSKPILPRGSHGLSNRVDRTKALGNSVVPQVAAIPLQRVHDLYYNE